VPVLQYFLLMVLTGELIALLLPYIAARIDAGVAAVLVLSAVSLLGARVWSLYRRACRKEGWQGRVSRERLDAVRSLAVYWLVVAAYLAGIWTGRAR